MITAFLGLAIFSESLPPLWWLGAALLVAGNVIIGRKDEGEGNTDRAISEPAAVAQSRGISPVTDISLEGSIRSDESGDEDVALIGDVIETDTR